MIIISSLYVGFWCQKHVTCVTANTRLFNYLCQKVILYPQQQSTKNGSLYFDFELCRDFFFKGTKYFLSKISFTIYLFCSEISLMKEMQKLKWYPQLANFVLCINIGVLFKGREGNNRTLATNTKTNMLPMSKWPPPQW